MASRFTRFAKDTRIFIRAFAAFAGRRGASAILLMLLGGFLEGVGLALLVPMLALLTDQTGGRLGQIIAGTFGRIGVETRFGQLAMLLAGFVAIMAVRALVLATRDRHLARLQHGFVENLRLRLITILADAPWHVVSKIRHARITNALSTEIQRSAAASQMMMSASVSIVMLVAQGLLAVLIAPLTAAFAFVVLAIGAVLMIPTMRQASKIGQEMVGRQLGMANTAAQLLGGLKMAMAENRQHEFTTEYMATAQRMTARQVAFMRQQSQTKILTSTIAALLGASILLAGIWNGTPTPTLLALLAIFSRMAGPAGAIQQSAQQIANSLPSFASIAELIAELKREGRAPDEDSAVGDLHGPIAFRGVGYNHPGRNEQAGVRDLTLEIAPGEVVGVVGASGAGKTTFVDLLCGLIEPDSGEAAIGDAILDRHTARRWRSAIAYVAQDPYLTNDSVRRNLDSSGTIDEATLWQAIEKVGAADLVRGWPEGLDTMVAERGSLLSGGERQRLVLARAMLRAPRLLILDEATNAIDIAAERDILDRLAALESRPTIVVIAHRVESLRICDRMLTFEEGRLIDDSVSPRQQEAAE